MKLILREDLFKALRALREAGLRELTISRAGSLWVSCWLSAEQMLCLQGKGIKMENAFV